MVWEYIPSVDIQKGIQKTAEQARNTVSTAVNYGKTTLASAMDFSSQLSLDKLTNTKNACQQDGGTTETSYLTSKNAREDAQKKAEKLVENENKITKEGNPSTDEAANSNESKTATVKKWPTYKLVEIGKPKLFNKYIDPTYRFGRYLQSKMSVIDLVPVDWGFDFKRLGKSFSDTSVDNTGGFYSIGYDQEIKKFQRICDHHGLSNEYVGIRLYTTDATTATDSINLQYKDSTFQQPVDTLSDVGRGIRDVARSVLGEQKTKEFAQRAATATQGGVGKLASLFNASEATQQVLKDMTGVVMDMVTQGNKMTFPKLWQNTTYHGNLSANIKLFSPYGHPKAVREFIIKPLLYLILLAAPQTRDGITYGGAIPVTINAHGMNLTLLGAFSSISFRRGGSDTSFNLYRQPLTVDISVDFQTLFDAFAVYDPEGYGVDKETLQRDNSLRRRDYDVINADFLDGPNPNDYIRTSTLMTTAGTILHSLKPIKLDDFPLNSQVYGLFEPPNRSDIPGTPAFTPIMGNVGSAISGAVSSIGQFANMITNVPNMIQQGLANAIYKASKDTVGKITGVATNALNGVTSKISDVKSMFSVNGLI